MYLHDNTLYYLLALILLFILANSLICFSLRKLFRKRDLLSGRNKDISIVIALKNESHNVKELISSLEKIDYPVKYYEVILVDDNSTDDTFEFLKSQVCDKPNYKLLKAENKLLPGKKGALDLGVKNALNPYIMITDADCRPEPGWVTSYVNKFEEYDFLFGIAPFWHESSLINNISCFENLRSSLLTFSLAGLGFPYSAAARSFGFRKNSFESVAGYNNTTETLSGDDDLVIREAVKYKFRIGTITCKQAFVYSSTKTYLKEYLIQKARHTTTSNHYLLKHKVLLAFWHLINLLFLFSPIFSFMSLTYLSPFFAKLITDLILVKKYQSKFSYNFPLFRIFYLQLFYETFIIVNYFNGVFNRKINWK